MTDTTKAASITGVCGIIGIAFSVFATHHFEQSKVRQAVGLASVVATGIYEWQWAGAGWKGYLTVEQNGYAHLEMQQFMKYLRAQLEHVQGLPGGSPAFLKGGRRPRPPVPPAGGWSPLLCGGSEKLIPLLKQEGEAKAVARDDGTELTVTIPVRFAIVDSDCNVKGLKDVQTLHGTLSRKVAFAGPIQYQTQGSSPIGDMVLVKDFQSGQH